MAKRKAAVSKQPASKNKKSKMANDNHGCTVLEGRNEKFTFFYRAQCPFSQHYMVDFTVDGVKYNCAEQYMMHQKAVLFKDKEMEEEIMKSYDPIKQKKLGRQVRNFDPSEWDSKCQDIVKKANKAKFEQNKDLNEIMLSTEGTTLVEASPRDRIWGIGMGANNPKALDRKTWRGRNLLGKILTDVREELIKEMK